MAATLQTLPPIAREYRAEQLATIDGAIDEIAARWSLIGPRFDSGWSLIGPTIASIVHSAQRDMARRADAYIPAVLEDTGQLAYVRPAAEINADALAELTGAGLPVYESLAAATIRSKQAVTDGASPRQALIAGGEWLSMTATTVLADTARSAETLGRSVRGVGYVRMVNGGACGRCVVQAGKWFRTNQGFLRHPRCKCTHIPAAEDAASDWRTNPDTYFHSLTAEQQIKLAGSKANAQAVVDGADLAQIVNAYRKTSGMRYAQESPIKIRSGLKFTTEGTTRRGLAGQQQAGSRRNGPNQMRLMPETIAMRAKNADDRLRLLRLYGWIADDAARTGGRAIFAEQRRVDRNARAQARRADRAWYTD